MTGCATYRVTELLERAAAVLVNLVGPPEVDLGRDGEVAGSLEIGLGHSVLAAGAEVSPPGHGSAVATCITTDVSEVEATLESVVSFRELNTQSIALLLLTRPAYPPPSSR